ncbi:hypothetical protein STRNTR1_0248 [Stenotrophomonas maltophilia]|nr:hypothetical protein STRNTR1_0248 [Stenotrophomonas maltophilia]
MTHITCQILGWPWPASLPSCMPPSKGGYNPDSDLQCLV